ncbi:MAG: class F sortase [Actinomycetia bacterium]|nr:class F sortase [Actinomycetes bacterium]
MATARRRRPGSLLAVLLLVLGSGSLGWAGGYYYYSQQPAPLPSATFDLAPSDVVAQAAADRGSTGESTGTTSQAPAMEPDQIVLPTINASAPMDYLGVDSGELLLPDGSRVTIYSEGSYPGDSTGTVLIAGHVNSETLARGALFDLGDIQPGDSIWVTDQQGNPVEYLAVKLEVLHKQELPQDIFTRNGEPRLVIVTCGGEIVTTASGRRGYESNVILTAVPA